MEKDKEIIDLLKSRGGTWSLIVLENDKEINVFDIEWGYDDGDEWSHITSNISPGPSTKSSINNLYSSEIKNIMDSSRRVPLNKDVNRV